MRFACMFAAVALMALPALAEEMRLDGAGITAALKDKTLIYDDGSSQNFQAGGATTYESGKPSLGSWVVQEDRYCSIWPPSDFLACYDVLQSADGQSLTFVSDGGERTTGHYAP